MTQDQIILKTKDFIKEKFSTDKSGHYWWHIYRVWKLAKHIAKNEPNANMFVVQMAALLHDMTDYKLHGGDEEAGLKATREWLDSLRVNNETAEHIIEAVLSIGFRGGSLDSKIRTIEAKIVSDADRLDAMGAIGIARAFAYGGAKGRSMYDSSRKPSQFDSVEAYKNNTSPIINHFYEKLLLLKDSMFTDTGKAVALHRHQYMQKFLEEFYDEWEGKL